MSGGFSAEWLAARAVWDRAARSPEVEGALVRWAETRPATLRILDLGAGSGNNQRHLAPLLEMPCEWLLADSDTALLERAVAEASLKADDRITVRDIDLATGDLSVLLGGADLVTASALFDLVSRDWLDRFLDALAERRAAFLSVLTYDGRIDIEGDHEEAENLEALVNDHQHGDKGFGPALGPEAHPALVEGLEQRGYRVEQGESDWSLTAGDPGARELVEGWVAAAGEIAPLDREEIAAWGAALLARPGIGIYVGHRDLFAVPPS
ncbi:class I SAM-dependent methyltransferase [Nisaea acidiphila]|uniref:Class I SAM-dependent methyltransferase n=1 Tax=Nisaea acidiphila TaxID=1862145 RepID=A0A9J7ANI8_9PROT|nr:class I SAM-dependent methyltransferase [Nisaea acidiphila]UUX49203.1 class I SAM-dependent methyltransferase [Nisaea acidiphila]